MLDMIEAGADALPDKGLAVSALVAALEEDIVLGRLHPRERLVEDVLIKRFGATRHTIRQALEALERLGLVERPPNRGALVRHYEAQEVEELHALRDLLEAEGARQIPLPLPRDALVELRAIQERHDAATASGDLPALFRSNLAFHRRLFACMSNRFLQEAITSASQHAHAFRFMSLRDPKYRETARREHHAMIDALEHGDREALVSLCRAHLVPTRDAYLRVLGYGLRT